MLKINEQEKKELLEVAQDKELMNTILDFSEICTEDDDVYNLYTNIFGISVYGDKYLGKLDTSSLFVQYITEENLLKAPKETKAFNKFLVILDKEFKEARGFAIEELGDLMGYNTEVTLDNTSITRDEISEELKKQINNSLTTIDNLYYELSSSWVNNYYLNSFYSDYYCSENEKVVIKLYSLNQESLDLAIDRLNKINQSLAK